MLLTDLSLAEAAVGGDLAVLDGVHRLAKEWDRRLDMETSLTLRAKSGWRISTNLQYIFDIFEHILSYFNIF